MGTAVSGAYSKVPVQVAGVTGQYFADSKPRKSAKSSYDTVAAGRLWRVSSDLVGLTAGRRN